MRNWHITLRDLAALMPRVAEEGGASLVIPREELKYHLGKNSVSEDSEVDILLGIVERILVSTATLDDVALHDGKWQFVSFPAQLLAFSLLQLLADERQNLFPPGFWEQGQHRPETLLEQQRNVLDWIEQARVAWHADRSATPIRYIYVAWALIKLDGKFLLHHREDRSRTRTGNYVLIGGRLNATDLPRGLSPAAQLAALHSPQSELAEKHLMKTLEREVEEETGLKVGQDFSYAAWRHLQPFRKVEGARSNRAFTEYDIHVYSISLTREGLVSLLDWLSESDRHAWLSTEEIASNSGHDGKAAFLDALLEDFDSPNAVRAALDAVPESIQDRYRYEKETDAIDIPLNIAIPMVRGKTGKESPVDIKLDDRQLDWLWLLAWHAKELSVAAQGNLKLLPKGWVKPEQGSPAMDELTTLAAYFANHEYPIIEVLEGEFFRLAIAPALIYFDSSAYRYSSKRAEDTAEPIFSLSATPRVLVEYSLGEEAGCRAVGEKMFAAIGVLNGTRKSADAKAELDEMDLKRLIRDQLDPVTKRLGLRKLIREEDGWPKIVCDPY